MKFNHAALTANDAIVFAQKRHRRRVDFAAARSSSGWSQAVDVGKQPGTSSAQNRKEIRRCVSW